MSPLELPVSVKYPQPIEIQSNLLVCQRVLFFTNTWVNGKVTELIDDLRPSKSPLFVKIELFTFKTTLFTRFPPKTGVTKIRRSEGEKNQMTSPHCSWINWISDERFTNESFTCLEVPIWL